MPITIEVIVERLQAVDFKKETWKPAAIPKDEAERTKVISSLDILDQVGTEPFFDGIVEFVHGSFNAPMAGISIIEGARDYKLSHLGMLKEVARDISWCSHVVTTGRTIIAEDTQKHEIFKEYPLVKDGTIRFYVGVPLSVDDVIVGVLCVLDYVPRTFSNQDRLELEGFAQTMMRASRQGKDMN
ncbi:GAF sensor signal transduction histidine kinase [Planoprotostelium fungivorum]|uniref:GAF sensor signal transduction histidine kinase n=1 Tax=Planoprotostelium fungivorum TaxID=1890364 RepID=A0A2P6N1B2_9EUKA|nr:GAF sensor signal transduction histidine kinase [Planoprotostelium fungivorum]